MNFFEFIVYLILSGLTVLCFILPYKSGQKKTAFSIVLFLGLSILIGLLGKLDFLAIFIWVAVILIQIVFLIYWGFRFFGKKKMAAISSIIVAGIFALILMEPWISDWTFNKSEAKEILSFHNFKLKDDFEIVRNESGGLRDYYHSFTLKISDSDHLKIVQEIRAAENFQVESARLNALSNNASNDTLNYETNISIVREYYSNEKMKDGTYHFLFQLSKKKSELSYIGSDE